VEHEDRVRVAAVNDYEIVVAGLAAMLSKYEDRLAVVDAIVIGESLRAPVDVALYDTFGRQGVGAAALRTLVDMPRVHHVAIFTSDLHPDLVAQAQAAGARGFIAKQLAGDEIADAILRVAKGEVVVATHASSIGPDVDRNWPGRQQGITERESQVLVLAAEGLSNREIAAVLYLSQHTVKGYVSQALRKLGLRNRVEAAAFVRAGGWFARSGGEIGLPSN
jgi:DNA-binding NarL/FixJ family response regulator